MSNVRTFIEYNILVRFPNIPILLCIVIIIT